MGHYTSYTRVFDRDVRIIPDMDYNLVETGLMCR